MRFTGTPCDRCSKVCLRIASMFSALLRLRFLRVKPSEAVSAIPPAIVSLVRKASARSRPFALNHSPVYSIPGFALKPWTTASASAQPGTRRGLTNEQTWMWRRPVSDSASISRTLSAVLIGPGSIWKPSRGPSSWTSTWLGKSVMVRSPSRQRVAVLKAAAIPAGRNRHASISGGAASRQRAFAGGASARSRRSRGFAIAGLAKRVDSRLDRRMQECFGFGLLIPRFDDQAGSPDRCGEVLGMPVPDRGQPGQGGDGRAGIEADVEIGLVVMPVARTKSDPHGAAGRKGDQGVEVEMVRPAAHRRDVQLPVDKFASGLGQQPIGIVK